MSVRRTLHLLLPLAAMVLPGHPAPANDEISGQARIIDGDTVAIGRHRLRLFGIDAPEVRQTCTADGTSWPCGRMATRKLRELVAGRPLACTKRDRDHHGRIIAVCRIGGLDINAWMVETGWALAYRKYSSTYFDREAAARDAGRGLWRGQFIPPWEWRRHRDRHRARPRSPNHAPPRHPAPAPSVRCSIKGNISPHGRIYHVPGGYYYDRTMIDRSRGERWFCSEAEARHAGWRRSRR